MNKIEINLIQYILIILARNLTRLNGHRCLKQKPKSQLNIVHEHGNMKAMFVLLGDYSRNQIQTNHTEIIDVV